uniref:Mitochondrial mRNA-processing protein COX24 C-terminal domain-containing protein n=1 Tax=Panagrolaimus sp. PS1159 TaxID=55785 RepID=A0AC35GL47_9BILA
MIPSSISKLGNVRHFSTTLKSLRSIVDGSHHQECNAFPIASIVPQKLYRSCNNVINGKILPIYCPTAQRPVKVYSFPTPNKVIIEAPTILSLLIEKVEPLTSIVPVVDPNQSNKLPMIAGPRMLTIRRKKMKKHKRRKRFDRDWFKYQKYHRQKKIKAEKVFRARMNDLMKTLETFDPMEHVKDTIKRAKREWSTDLTPSGKKKYPHWSELMTLEELYNVEKSDYIDKRAGLPNEEDAQQIAQLRQKYDLLYSRKTKVDGNE